MLLFGHLPARRHPIVPTHTSLMCFLLSEHPGIKRKSTLPATVSIKKNSWPHWSILRDSVYYDLKQVKWGIHFRFRIEIAEVYIYFIFQPSPTLLGMPPLSDPCCLPHEPWSDPTRTADPKGQRAAAPFDPWSNQKQELSLFGVSSCRMMVGYDSPSFSWITNHLWTPPWRLSNPL